MKRIWVLLLCGLLLAAGVTAGDEFEIIRQGSKGERVVRIQERLFDLGFYTYKPTGSYQTVTRSAVMRYQAESGLMIRTRPTTMRIRGMPARLTRVGMTIFLFMGFTSYGGFGYSISCLGNTVNSRKTEGKDIRFRFKPFLRILPLLS